MSKHIKDFVRDGGHSVVEFIETTIVADGVECDVYKFTDNALRDLAIVRVEPGCKTPLQKVLKGEKTIEGLMSGKGSLTVWPIDGVKRTYAFRGIDESEEVIVGVGEMMQWSASEDGVLTFYEICEPPYEDGRFENVTT